MFNTNIFYRKNNMSTNKIFPYMELISHCLKLNDYIINSFENLHIPHLEQRVWFWKVSENGQPSSWKIFPQFNTILPFQLYRNPEKCDCLRLLLADFSYLANNNSKIFTL